MECGAQSEVAADISTQRKRISAPNINRFSQQQSDPHNSIHHSGMQMGSIACFTHAALLIVYRKGSEVHRGLSI